MEYLLLGAFGIGLLLFVLSWLRVIFAGFGHHFVTGIVSIVPVLNLLILPSLWHRVHSWVLAGIIGLLVAIGCWYAGADKHVYRYTLNTGMNIPVPQGSIGTEGLDLNQNNSTQNIVAINDNDAPAAPLPSGKALPKSALYSMSYQETEAANLGQYVGHYIRLTRVDRKRFEGKVLGTDSKGIVIERRINSGVVEQKINFSDITQAEVMKKQ